MQHKTIKVISILFTILLFINFSIIYQIEGKSTLDIDYEVDDKETKVEVIFYNTSKFNEIADIDKDKIVERYESYSVVRISSTRLEELKKRGYDLKRMPSEDNVPSWISDKTSKELERTFFGSVDQSKEMCLLRFIGPLKRSWKNDLELRGIKFYEKIGLNTYLVRNELSNIDKITKRGYVESIKPYKINYKFGEKLASSIGKDGQEEVNIELKMSIDSDPDELGRYVRMLGGYLLSHENGELNYDTAVVQVKKSKLKYIAEREDVVKIFEKPTYELMNDVSSWVIQSYDTSDKTDIIWDKGILGQGQIVGEADTGIDYDHVMFRNTKSSAGTPGETHRKIVLYEAFANDKDSDYSGHGTHVAGSIAGDWKNYGEPDDYDGMAPSAKIAFYDIGGEGDSLNIPDDLNNMFQTQYEAGARIFSNSWGASASYYTADAEECDEFMWKHNDALILFANGNSGPKENTVGSPATAKNIVSVGNSINGESEDMAKSSSNGPTDEWRLKPTVSAPGTSIVSADSDGDLSTYNDGLIQMTGTSMATPTTAGATALVRQYYTEGWYPSGQKSTQQGFVPSGSLMKATLINSAWDMDGEYTDGSIPATGQGWGKINLDNTLYFDGDSNKLNILNNGSEESFSSSGQQEQYEFQVGENQDLKVTLVWTDYPGAALQNDLNLLVEAPNGTIYKGNVIENGYSVSGGNFDSKNVSEQVILNSSRLNSGRYTITVVGESISHSPQRFSLIASGDVSTDIEMVEFEEDRYNIPPISNSVGVKLTSSESNEDPLSIETKEVLVKSDSETGGELLSLSETAVDSGIFEGEIEISNGSVVQDGLLQVKNGDNITVEYQSKSSILTDTAVIDSDPPELIELVIPSSELNNLKPRTAKLSWTTDKKTSGMVLYGTSGHLTQSVNIRKPSYKHEVILKNLEPNTTYKFKLILVDSCDKPNVAVEDNEGALYQFKTPSWPMDIGEGYSGYVQSIAGNKDSIFDEDYMFSGYYYQQTLFGPQEGPFYSAIMFDTSLIKGKDIESASLHLFPKSRYSPSTEYENWTFEVLENPIENAFPDPTFGQIEDASRSFKIDTINSRQLADVGGSDVIDIRSSDIEKFQQNADDGKVVIRITGPSNINYTNVRSWYSGHSIGNDDLLFYSPRLKVRCFDITRGKIEFDRESYSDTDYANLRLQYANSRFSDNVVDDVEVDIKSNAEIETISLTETAENSNEFVGHIKLSSYNQAGVLKVEEGEQIQVEFMNDNFITIRDKATIDNTKPTISDIQVNTQNDLTATLTWNTDEASVSMVKYGASQEMGAESYDRNLKTTHKVKLTDLCEGTKYYYTISSIDEAGNEEVKDNDGQLYSFTTPSSNIQPSILLVNDNGDVSGYQSGLDNLGYEYDFESIASDELPQKDLKQYDIVIWVVGGFSATLTVNERNLLKDYLDNNGNLYINGEDIGYEIGDTSFYSEYLHSTFKKDNGDGVEIDGIASDPISDGFSNLQIGGDLPDNIEPKDEAYRVFKYDTNKTAAIRADTSSHKVVYMSCNFFEGPETKDKKDSVMGRIVNWLEPSSSDKVGPVLSELNYQNNTIQWGDDFEFTGILDDTVSKGSEIIDAEYFIDRIKASGEGSTLQINQQNSDGSISEVSGIINTRRLSLGIHHLYVHGKDSSSNWGKFRTVRLDIKSNVINDTVPDNSTDNSTDGNDTDDSENDSSVNDLNKFDIELRADQADGWNFISSILMPDDDNLTAVLENDTFGICDNYEKVMYFDSENDEWKTYIPDRPDYYNHIHKMNITKGMWIQVNSNCTLTVVGSRPNQTTIMLEPGWNMVGYPSNTTRDAVDILPSEVTEIGFYNPNKENKIEYTSNLNIQMSPGNAYWVYNSADYRVEWTINY